MLGTPRKCIGPDCNNTAAHGSSHCADCIGAQGGGGGGVVFRSISIEQEREYDAYFDDCERANKIPLCFDEWVKTL